MKNLMVRKHTFTMLTSRLVAIALFAALLSAAPFHAALAQNAPDLGTASTFAVLGGTAVTLTSSAVIGDVGSPVAVTLTTSTVVGTVYPAGDPIAIAAYNDFLAVYDDLAPSVPPPPEQWPCTGSLNTAYTDATLTLPPGVYCNTADVTFTRTTLTLVNPQNDPNAVWIFKIGTAGTGALTGTNFSVVMAGGGSPCNVYWWVKAAATLTDSNFLGTILAGAAITVTRGTFNGDALAQAAVTMTGTAVSVCSSPVPPPIDYCKEYCKDYCKEYWKDHDKYHCKDHEKDYCKDHYCQDHDKNLCTHNDKDNDKNKDNDKDKNKDKNHK